MRTVLGFEPAYTTAEAFADFGSAIEPTGGRIGPGARRRWPGALVPGPTRAA